MTIVAHRFRDVPQSATVAISALARELKRQGRDVIGLAAGEPDFDTPEHILKAGEAALRGGKTRYAPPSGIPELREAICTKLRRDNGLDFRPSQVSVGCGAKQSIFNIFMASIEAGDEVVVPAPHWVSFVDIVAMLGGRPVSVPCGARTGFKLTPEVLERHLTPRTRWLVLCSPSNPTGAVYSDAELAALAEILARHPRVWVMSDHIYEHLVYEGGPARTIGQVAPDMLPRSVIVNGVSKAYCMTGWRVGFVAGPKEIIDVVDVIQSQATTSTSTISQWAAVEALTGDQGFIARNNLEYRRRRDLVVAMLNEIDGITCTTPPGAFYVFPDCSGLIGRTKPDGSVVDDDSQLAAYFLADGGVAIVPGTAFAMSPNFRLAYSASYEDLRTACGNLQRVCAELT
jgi:aspartate aminotransferase